LPVKKGFRNVNHKEYAVVNLDDLQKFFENGAEVTPQSFIEKGIIGDVMDGVKILAFGEISKKLKVSAQRFSKVAAEKIVAAGGEAITL
jgi:large subunit ribosomal protein L15